jgi:hypothetical protein
MSTKKEIVRIANLYNKSYREIMEIYDGRTSENNEW